jgi:hypothetical protein
MLGLPGRGPVLTVTRLGAPVRLAAGRMGGGARAPRSRGAGGGIGRRRSCDRNRLDSGVNCGPSPAAGGGGIRCPRHDPLYVAGAGLNRRHDRGRVGGGDCGDGDGGGHDLGRRRAYLHWKTGRRSRRRKPAGGREGDECRSS